MTTPQRLDQIITDVQNGQSVTPQTADEQFAADLTAFAQEFTYHPVQAVQNTPPRRRSSKTLRLLATMAAGLALLAATILTVPPLRAFALSILDPLFPTTDDDEITITYNEFADDELVFFDTLDDLVAYTGFDLLTLPDLQDDLEETYFEYNAARNVAIQRYNTRSRLITISQQPIDSAEANGLLAFSFDLEIPPDAQVEDVQVGEQMGQLLRGMWVATSDQPNSSYVWSNNFWHFTLRWQDETTLYEVMTFPVRGGPTRDEMVEEIITLANTLTLAE